MYIYQPQRRQGNLATYNSDYHRVHIHPKDSKYIHLLGIYCYQRPAVHSSVGWDKKISPISIVCPRSHKCEPYRYGLFTHYSSHANGYWNGNHKLYQDLLWLRGGDFEGNEKVLMAMVAFEVLDKLFKLRGNNKVQKYHSNYSVRRHI